MALQILNLSIYNTDFYNFHNYTLAERANLNPVDSFAELILERIDGFEDSFPESEREQQEKPAGNLKHNISFKFVQLNFANPIAEGTCFSYAASDRELALFQNKYSYLFFEEINHPPS